MNRILADIPPQDYPYVLGMMIVAVLLSFYWFVRNWKRLRLIEDTPTAKLRSAHQGYVELEGKGQFIDNRPVYAPLSNHPCLWYSSKIEQQETFTENGRTQTRWNVVYSNTSEHRFKLTDGASSCDVDPDRAEVNGNEKLVWYGNTEWPTRTQMLESQSIVHAMSNRYRYSESLILPGQPLYILGQFSTASAMAQKSVRDVMINVINEWKRDQPALRERFDINCDGNIDQQEWETARTEAHTEAQRIYDQLAVEPDTHIIAKPRNSSQPFIISVYPQALLAQKFRRNSYAALAVCIASVCATAWLIDVHG